MKDLKAKAQTKSTILLFSLLIALSACSTKKTLVPSTLSSRSIVNEEVIHPLSEQFLQEMIAAEHFSGVALVLRHKNIVHARAYGPATLDAANRLDSLFHVASVTKQFTAAAVMQLVEKDVIDLDGRINDFLPKIYRSDIWSPVRIHHLLSHTSGIPDYVETRDYYEVIDGWAFGDTVDGMIREAMAKELQFEPGTDFQYSNIGYTLLGEIIREQSGSLYATFIKDNLLDPIGMTDSRIHVAGHEPLPGEGSGLRWSEEDARHIKDDVLSLPVTSSDGGLVTTLDDFIRWIAVYRDMAHPNLSAASLERMMQPSTPSASYLWPEQGLRGEAAYGFGLVISGDLIMHEGYIVGFRSYFIHSRNDDLSIVVFTNNTSNDVFRIATGLFKIHD